MKKVFDEKFKLGILGGGQLGRMLAQVASNWPLHLSILDKDPSFPAAKIADSFVQGDFKNFDDVYRFGKSVDVLSIEIEQVNIAALEKLESEGVTIRPSAKCIRIIQDKGLQKTFFSDHDLPSSPFHLFSGSDEILKVIEDKMLFFPFVQKSREAGYDGRGVAIIKGEDDIYKLMDTPSLVENLVDIDTEVAVIVARNAKGDIKAYPPVSMSFHPDANLVEYVACPATITDQEREEAIRIAKDITNKLDVVGLLAVELFLDKKGQISINEVAPRTHNSGHHTIEACICSQFEQQIRAILDLPLGNCELIRPAVMINLLGEEGYEGPANYRGLEKALAIKDLYIHIYGKTFSKPFRKMGHFTTLGDTLDEAISKAKKAETLMFIGDKDYE